MTTQILRWSIPVDGYDHTLELSSHLEILSVGCPDPEVVDFWAAKVDYNPKPRTFRAFGTGHEVPNGYIYVGTAPRHASGLVWHLFERIAT